ncbi:MAG: DAK2 domain-containing protein [Acidimicrobiia bacterium]
MTGPLEHLGLADVCSAVTGYRDALRGHQERLNRLNVYPVPDGDTGTNMALTLESVVAEMRAADETLAAVCKAISHGSLMGARGNSGVILSQILRGVADRLKTADPIDGRVVAEALSAASAAAYTAVMKPVEGTILTVVREAAEAAQAAAEEPDASLERVLDAAALRGAEALERTPTLLPVLAEAGVVDAGGAGFLLLLDVLLNVVAGRPVPAAEVAVGAAPAPMSRAGGEGDVGDLRYEVMFLLESADDAAVGRFKQAWAAVGDSIVVVGGEGIWNCHIHTDDIGAAIEAGIDAGRPRGIRVTDLADQVEEERWVREGTAAAPPGTDDGPHRTTAVVAVGAGDGAVAILRSLGASGIVAGGQSMNPSTAELLAAIDAARSDEVVVLPNNKNVIGVAERAAEMASKPVRVVPTTSLAEGFAALMGYDPDEAAEPNVKAMAEAAHDVAWGEVTWSVRDSATAAGPVKEGDHLGLLGHDIVAADPDLAGCACALLDRLVTADHELVTVCEGEAARPEATERIKEWLAGHRPDVAVEVHRGDQPLSAYLFSAE